MVSSCRKKSVVNGAALSSTSSSTSSSLSLSQNVITSSTTALGNVHQSMQVEGQTMSEDLDNSNKGSDLPDYEDENSKSPKKEFKEDGTLLRIKKENVKDSDEEEFDSELEEEEEIASEEEDSEFDDEAESEEELQEEDENGELLILNLFTVHRFKYHRIVPLLSISLYLI